MKNLLPTLPYLKVLITCLLLVLEVCDGKPTYRKSWTENLLVWSDFFLYLFLFFFKFLQTKDCTLQVCKT